MHLHLWYRKYCLFCPVFILVTNILSNWLVGLGFFFCGDEVEMTQAHCVFYLNTSRSCKVHAEIIADNVMYISYQVLLCS